MASRIALIVTLIFVTVAGMSVLSDIGLADTAQTYTFEACDEGWTTTTHDATNGYPPGLAAWARRAPGHESGFSYNTGQYSDLQWATLLSPIYPDGSGGPITVSYSIAYDVEVNTTSYWDYIAFEWQAGGGAWTLAKQYAGQNAGFPDFIQESITIEPPPGALRVRFRITSDETFSSPLGDYAGGFVDNVFIPLTKPDGVACAGGTPSASGSATPSTSPSPTNGGPGKVDCTITGTPYSDFIDGTEGDDVICGKGGDDVLDGLGGDDLILGNRGDDQLVGGDGSDELRGGKGADNIRGNEGDDRLRGGSGRDDLDGGPGSDDCKGGAGKDKVRNC